MHNIGRKMVKGNLNRHGCSFFQNLQDQFFKITMTTGEGQLRRNTQTHTRFSVLYLADGTFLWCLIPVIKGVEMDSLKFFLRSCRKHLTRLLWDRQMKVLLKKNYQKKGVIICIPKTDKPRDRIKNQTITLSTVVFKISAVCTENRMKKVLPSLIHEDPSGFIQDILEVILGWYMIWLNI